MKHKNLLTQEGYNLLVIELSDLKKKQDHLVDQIEDVAQPDESGEDGLATQLKEELEVVNERIDNIEQVFEDFQIITDGECNSLNEIQLGCTVKIKLSNDGEKKFTIVSHLEADPLTNRISDQSPLGKALIGKKLNDEVEVTAPVGKIIYKIVSIN